MINYKQKKLCYYLTSFMIVFIYSGKEYDWSVTTWEPAQILKYTDRVESEKEVYYTPATEMELPCAPGSSGRVGVMDEGVYTGEVPRMANKNLNKIKNR